jgi:hypothetical protein
VNRYGDTCPACGGSDVSPYAVIVGGSEEYGYQCQACQVTWPVLAHHDPIPAVAAVSLRNRVVRASLAARGRSHSSTASRASDSQPAAGRA